jgi:hypothetical protein
MSAFFPTSDAPWYVDVSIKSKTGRETTKRDIELVRKRLREAEQIAEEMA